MADPAFLDNAARKLGPLNTMLMLNTIPVLVFGIEAWLGRSFSAVDNLYLRGVSTRR